MKAETLFLMEDVIFKQYGLYAMWTAIFISNFVVLLCDGTNDESRDFNVLANGFSVIYCSIASANVLFGNKLPSAVLLIAGPIHQYLYWLLFAYFKGTPVLGRHPIGVMNWFTTFLVGLFTFDMIIKTWLLSFYPNYYLDYSERKNPKQKNIQNKVTNDEEETVEM